MRDGRVIPPGGPLDVLVVGAGGLGSYVGAVLWRAGHAVTLVARGAHAERIRADGLQVTTPEGSWTAHPRVVPADALTEEVPDPAAGGGHPGADGGRPTDLVFVAVKAYSLDEIAPAVARLALAGATVVSLLNGVDVADRLEAAGAPRARIVDGIAYLTAFRTGPGAIERKGMHQRLLVAGAAAHEMLARTFAGTGVEVVAAGDIRTELWMKMAVVCSLATLCGLTDSEIGPIRQHPFGAALQAGAIAEVLAVGRATGAPLPSDAEARVGGTLDAFGPDFYPSVLHDLRSGRPTEMDHLGGAVSRLGRRHGVPTPLTDAATVAVALRERRSDTDGLLGQ